MLKFLVTVFSSYVFTIYCIQGRETSGLILISGLRTFILSMIFHFFACSQDHPFISEVVIWVNILVCLKQL